MASEIPELEWHLRQFESGTENLRKYRDTMSRMQLVFRYFWTSFNSYFIMIGLLSLLEAVLNCADSIFNGEYVLILLFVTLLAQLISWYSDVLTLIDIIYYLMIFNISVIYLSVG